MGSHFDRRAGRFSERDLQQLLGPLQAIWKWDTWSATSKAAHDMATATTHGQQSAGHGIPGSRPDRRAGLGHRRSDSGSSGQPSVIYAADVDLDSRRRPWLLEPIGRGPHCGSDGRIHEDFAGMDTALDLLGPVLIRIALDPAPVL